KGGAVVKADRPGGGGPGADQHRLCAQLQQMLKKLAADAAALHCRDNISMADKVNVAHVLQSHDTGEAAAILVAPELDAGGAFAVELRAWHVRLVPAVGRDHSAIGLGGGIDDGKNVVALVLATAAGGHLRAPHPRLCWLYRRCSCGDTDF